MAEKAAHSPVGLEGASLRQRLARTVAWWSALWMWALFSYSLRPWLLPLHLLWAWGCAGEGQASRWWRRGYAALMVINGLGLASMLGAMGWGPLLGPLVLLAVGAGVWRRLKKHAPAPPVLMAAWGLLAFVQLWRFYHTPTPELAQKVAGQRHVQVILAMGQHPALGQNPRFVVESCDGQSWLVGTAMKPLLSRIPQKKDHGRVITALQGKATDLMAVDCPRGLLVVGDNRDHRLYVLKEKSLAVVYESHDLGAQVSYVAHDAPRQRVFFGEDVGFKTWRLDVANPRRPQLTTFKMPAYDLLMEGDVLVVASKGWLLRLDPDDMTVLTRRFLPVPLQPQLFLDRAAQRLYVTDLLGGRVRVYDSQSLAPLGGYWVGPGVRYVWVDDAAQKLITLNYFSGQLQVRDLKTGRLQRGVLVGRKGRAITTTRNGQHLLMATNVGLVKVSRSLWRR